jgi:hypothetical protein
MPDVTTEVSGSFTKRVITWTIGEYARVVRSWSPEMAGRVVRLTPHPVPGATCYGFWVMPVDPPHIGFEAHQIAPLTPEELAAVQLKAQSSL